MTSWKTEIILFLPMVSFWPISQYLPFFEVEVSTGTQWSFLWKPADLVGIVEYAFWLKNTELG